MQQQLITHFEAHLSKFDRLDMHNKLLRLYAAEMHDTMVHRKRYAMLAPDMDEQILDEVYQKTINYREEAKEHIWVLGYCIETNLFIERANTEKVKKSNIEHLLAFSNWLVKLQMVSDICFFNEQNIHINVDGDYLVDIISSAEEDELVRVIQKRNYDNHDYIHDFSEKSELESFNKVIEAFEQDVEISFQHLMTVCEYLKSVFQDDPGWEELCENVIFYNKSVLIKNLNAKLEKQISIESSNDVLRFLSIEPSCLKEWKGEMQFFIPSFEREKRPHRIDIKPLLDTGEAIVYSPIMVKRVSDSWKYGLLEFYPPFEAGLPETMKALKQWKALHEERMVYDVAGLFRSAGIKHVWTNAKLHKLDKPGGHPLDIGDYDTVAFDDDKNVLWVIESKVLNKVGSVYEDQMQQKSYFSSINMMRSFNEG